MMQDFETIKEFPDYSIDRDGNIYNLNTGLKRKTLIDKDGYITITFRIKGKSNHRFVHRLIAIAFIPNPNNWPQINHINGIKSDNRIENLEWCTISYNIRDVYQKGRRKPTTHHSKLTMQERSEIKKSLREGATHQLLADKYKVSITTIFRVKNNKRYV